MRTLGILVRTNTDQLLEHAFHEAEEILSASRDGGHIFIDLAGEQATRENLWRILDGIGAPGGDLLKLIVFYCHGTRASPLDHNGAEFVTDGVLSRFAGWGVYCIGCQVGQTLGHRLLSEGARFVIAFDQSLVVDLRDPDDIFRGLNVGVVRMLREGIGPRSAARYMREYFLEALDTFIREYAEETSHSRSYITGLSLTNLAESLTYFGPAAVAEPWKVQVGHEAALEYQERVAALLESVFSPELAEPHLEVTTDSGASRYDIVFANRSEAGFWHDLKITRGNSLVIFDAKNKGNLTPSDADQMLRYASPMRGMAVFIVTRDDPPPAFFTRAIDLAKEKKVCLLVFSDQDLVALAEAKESGSDPSAVVAAKYRDLLERT